MSSFVPTLQQEAFSKKNSDQTNFNWNVYMYCMHYTCILYALKVTKVSPFLYTKIYSRSGSDMYSVPNLQIRMYDQKGPESLHRDQDL
jgi:hypothetical protein